MQNPKIANFFHDKPLFGIDIGHGSLKVMQLAERQVQNDGKAKPRVVGYGSASFDKSAHENGTVIKPEIIAEATHKLFKNHLIGDITTRRVAIALPAYRTFTRSVKLPRLNANEVEAAVQLEAEQYISVPLEELYIDYEIIKQTPENTELFIVAVPQTIVDSYLDLAQLMGLEVVLIEPTLSSSARLFQLDAQSDVATCVIDFGSLSSDISIVDGKTLVMGTVQGGGENFTELIRNGLKVSSEEASLIKTRYGLGVSKRQREITQALDPTLQQIVKEIRRMLRYYEERYGAERPVKQVVTIGGGANMPGLSEYFIEHLRIAVRHFVPWHHLDTKGLEQPPHADMPMYATVAGLSLADHRKVFSRD